MYEKSFSKTFSVEKKSCKYTLIQGYLDSDWIFLFSHPFLKKISFSMKTLKIVFNTKKSNFLGKVNKLIKVNSWKKYTSFPLKFKVMIF